MTTTLNLKEPDMDTETHTELPTERMWCLACGTVTRDQHCDCTRMATGTANFVNYADRLREDCRQAITEAAQLRTSHDALVAALRKIMDTAEGNECRKIARAALSSIGGGK